jgi:ATP-dependent DNA ligase
VFDEGEALFQAVWSHGREGGGRKRRSGEYRPGYRGWVKVKNPAYWRRESEVEGFRRSLARRQQGVTA